MQGRKKCSKIIGRLSIVTTLLSFTVTSPRVVNPLGFAGSVFNPFRFTGDGCFSECSKLPKGLSTNKHGDWRKSLVFKVNVSVLNFRDMQNAIAIMHALYLLSAQCSVLGARCSCSVLSFQYSIKADSAFSPVN